MAGFNPWWGKARGKGWYRLDEGTVARPAKEGESAQHYDEKTGEFLITAASFKAACELDGLELNYTMKKTVLPKDAIGRTITGVFRVQGHSGYHALALDDGTNLVVSVLSADDLLQALLTKLDPATILTAAGLED